MGSRDLQAASCDLHLGSYHDRSLCTRVGLYHFTRLDDEVKQIRLRATSSSPALTRRMRSYLSEVLQVAG